MSFFAWGIWKVVPNRRRAVKGGSSWCSPHRAPDIGCAGALMRSTDAVPRLAIGR